MADETIDEEEARIEAEEAKLKAEERTYILLEDSYSGRDYTIKFQSDDLREVIEKGMKSSRETLAVKRVDWKVTEGGA